MVETLAGALVLGEEMKTKLSIIGGLLAGVIITSASAQTAPGYPPGTSTTVPASGNTSLTGSSMTFSNSSGQVYTVDQLAAQLRNLRAAVDLTLPMLTAFNQSATATGNSQNLAGRLEGLVSGALNRNGSNSGMTNLLGSLRGLLGNNATTSSGTDTKTSQDLVTLQNDIQPLPGLFQGLNIGGTAAFPNGSQIISSPANASYTTPPTNTPGAPPTPTGRQ